MRAVWGGLALVASVCACERGGASGDASDASASASATELDAGALRASAIDGLEAAAADPVLASELGLAQALTRPDVEIAIERMLARVGANEGVTAASDRLFTEVQAGPAMRAALAEYARQNPELDLTGLTEGFVAYVDERLTRVEIAETITAVLRARLQQVDPALGSALMTDGGGAEQLATAILVAFTDAKLRGQLERRLGKDPSELQQRLVRRLGSAGRVGALLGLMGEQLRGEAGTAALVRIVDDERTAELLAGALGRVLDDPPVRDHCEVLFGLALADAIDVREFERELGRVLDEPAVVREAGSLLAAVAREPVAREAITSVVAAVVAAPGFGDRLVEALD